MSQALLISGVVLSCVQHSTDGLLTRKQRGCLLSFGLGKSWGLDLFIFLLRTGSLLGFGKSVNEAGVSPVSNLILLYRLALQ